MKNGIVILFEDSDGAGKTTVLEQALPVLRERGYDVVTMREPDSVKTVERIRDAILDTSRIITGSKTELLSYMIARRQYYAGKVLPALEAGKVVLINRFIDSSITYQGVGRGLDKDIITRLNGFITDGREPDLMSYFDVESEIGLARIARNVEREVNRLSLEKLGMYKRVRESYLASTEQEGRIVVIDASRELADVVPETPHTVPERLAKNGQRDLDGIRALVTPTF